MPIHSLPGTLAQFVNIARRTTLKEWRFKSHVHQGQALIAEDGCASDIVLNISAMDELKKRRNKLLEALFAHTTCTRLNPWFKTKWYR